MRGLCGLLLWAAAAMAQVGQGPDAVAIVKRSVERDAQDNRRAKDYTYKQRVVQRTLDGAGKVEKTEVTTYDVVLIGDRTYSKKIEKNDRPLEGSEAKQAKEHFDKAVAKHENQSERERKKQAAEAEKRREEGRAFLAELPQAMELKLVGEEAVSGQKAWVIDAWPRKGYRGKVKNWEILTKFRGRLWIDQTEYRWVKIEAESIAPVSFGWVLARLDKGAVIRFEQGRVNDEVWLPLKSNVKFGARLALVKKFRQDVDVEWREYRKFSTDSRVVSAEELKSGEDPVKR